MGNELRAPDNEDIGRWGWGPCTLRRGNDGSVLPNVCQGFLNMT